MMIPQTQHTADIINFIPEVRQEKNFLSHIIFNKLSTILNGSDFQWFFNPSSLTTATHPFKNDTHFMFTHTLFRNKTITSDWFETFEPILYSFDKKIEVNQLVRVKFNLYTNQNKKLNHTAHWDSVDEKGNPDKDINIAILNFTTCNGGTKINEKFYASNANEVLMFNNTLPHQGIVQTDVPIRVILNIGWR